MKKYKYQAVNKKGETKTGIMEARSPEDVANTLFESMLTPVKITEKVDFQSLMSPPLQKLKVPGKEKVIFFREFSTMISAGLPIDDALDVSIAQASNAVFKRVLTEITRDVRAGTSLASSLGKFPKVFSQVEVSLIAAGEVSGKLDSILEALADDVEKQSALKAKVQGALAYPIFILGIAAAVVSVITVKLVPAMASLYQSFGASTLPLPTEMLEVLSEVITNYYLIIIIVAVALYLLYRYYKATPDGAVALAGLSLQIPVVGVMLSQFQMITFIKTYALLIQAGVPVVNSLHLVAKTMSNKVYENAVEECAKEIEKGVSLAVALSKYDFIPSILWRSVAIGEETGKTEEILEKVGAYFEGRLNDQVNNLTKLIEPVMLVVLGAIVGFIAIAIYLPIYNFSSVIH